MKQILHSPLIEVLNLRVFISRETKLLKLEQISKEWEISRSTLHRYISPKYRIKSRTDAIRWQLTHSRDKEKCYKCKTSLKEHERCPICTILVHENPCIHLALVR